MGEIFRRETAEHPAPFTGERLTAAIGGQVQIEHYHRYLFARSLVSGLDVLDVASGEGYGAALLAQVARSVVGLETSAPTVRCAIGNFVRPNLHFLQGDARAMPLTDRCVDAVVSFETIEHFDRQDEFLREVRRVLRPDGKFIVSTPDRDVYSPAGSAANRFHVHELSHIEFVSLLQGVFRHVLVIRQRPLIGSTLLSDSGSPASPLVFERRGETHLEACVGLPRAPYLVAVASDRDLPPLPPSLYIDRSDLDTDRHDLAALTHRLVQTQTELNQTIQRADTAEQAHATATSYCEELRQQNETLQGEIGSLHLQCSTLHDQINMLHDQLGMSHARVEGLQQETKTLQDHLNVLQRRFNGVQSSLRTFLRGYLPLLRRHLFGQRP